MPDPEIKIKITSEADNKGVDDSTKAVDKNKEATKELGVEAEKTVEKIDKLDTAQKEKTSTEKGAKEATTKVTKATEELGVEAEKTAPKIDKLDRSEKEKTKTDKEAAESTNWFKSSLAELRKEVPLVDKALKLLSNPITQVVALFTSLVLITRKALVNFGGLEEKSASLQQALAQQGNQTKENVALYGELSDELGRLTGDVTAATEVLSILTSAGTDPSNIKETLEAVKNFAGITGNSLENSARAIGKAVQGNFDTLREWGIVIDRTGDKAQDLEILFQQLADRGAGQLEARSKTLNGTLDRLSGALGDLFTAIGGVLDRNGLLKTSMEGIIFLFETWTDALGKPVGMLTGIINKLGDTAAQQDAAAEATKRHKEELEGLDTRLGEINEKYERQKKLLDEQKQGDERVLAAAKQFRLADARSRLTGVELKREEFEIEREFAQRERDLRDRHIAADVLAKGELASEKQGELGRLKNREGELEDSIRRGSRDDARNRDLASLKAELQRNLAAQELINNSFGPGFSPDVELFEPTTIARAAILERRAAKLNFAYSDLDPVRLQQRATTLRKLIGDGTPRVTTTAQESRQLGEIRNRIAGLEPQIPGLVGAASEAQDAAIRAAAVNDQVDLFGDATAFANFGNTLRTDYNAARQQAGAAIQNNAQQRGQGAIDEVSAQEIARMLEHIQLIGRFLKEVNNKLDQIQPELERNALGR